MYKILVTGGAGYVGSVLIGYLLDKGYDVTALDNLMYSNGHTLINYFKKPHFAFRKGDVRDESLMKEMVKDKDFIIHLAAIVGFPACEKDQDLAVSVNLDSTKLLSGLLSKDQGVLYASTGSNYGAVVGEICTEETPLNPMSLYGTTKTEAERWLLDNNATVANRYATAFGLSPRMRLDLLINDFVYQAVINRYLIMFEKAFKRTFIHVDDMARSFLFAIENFDRMNGQVFNIGDDTNNYSKEDVALLIKQKVDYYLHFADVGEDADKRNYEVSYDKVRALGFNATVSVEEGIDQLIGAIPAIEYQSRFRNV
jgi:nucleoside-diphosphate-sugar epimerase